MKYFLPLLFFFCLSTDVFAETDLPTAFSEHIPSHVQSVEDENTVEQKSREVVETEAEGLAKEWLEKSDIDITNPHFIEQLNGTDVNRSIFAFGYSSEVYLGRWPLTYQSTGSSVNWAYQKVNDNYIAEGQLMYVQNEEEQVNGGLQSKVANSDQVQNMILKNTRERINWPIDYQAVFGSNTEKKLPMSNETAANHLEAYVGAVKETGSITYGEVYLTMTGRKQELTVKNIIEEEVVAWLPIQNHLAFHLKNEQPN